MTKEELERCGLFIESFEDGYLIADYSGKRKSKFGVLFAGRSLKWKSDPLIRDIFDSESEAIENAVNFLEKDEQVNIR